MSAWHTCSDCKYFDTFDKEADTYSMNEGSCHASPPSSSNRPTVASNDVACRHYRIKGVTI